MIALIPASYRWLAFFLMGAVLFGFGYVKGAAHERDAWDASKAAIAAAEAKVITARLSENLNLAIKQAANAAAIQQDHDHEIASLHVRIAAAPRLRIGPAFCDRSASTASVSDATSSDAASPGARLLSDGMDDAVKSLIDQSEDVAATARACQAGAWAAGIVP